MVNRHFLAFSLGCSLAALSAFAALGGEEPAEPRQEVVATVVALRGKVEATDAAGKARQLAVKTQIFREDTLKTAADGRLQLMFTDNTVVNLGPKTEIKVEKYSYNPQAQRAALSTRVKDGTFQVKAGEIGKISPENFKTVTPVGTIGIRGSIFAGSLQGGVLFAIFLGGQGITVANDFGQVTITASGFGTQVREGQPPSSPSSIPLEQIMSLRNIFLANGEGAGDSSGGWDLGGETFDSSVNIPGVDIITGEFFAPLFASNMGQLSDATNVVEQTISSGLAGDLLQIAQQNYGFGEYEVIAWGLVELPQEGPEFLVNGTLLNKSVDKFTSTNGLSGIITIYEEADDEDMRACFGVGGPYGYDLSSAREFAAGLGGYYYSGDTRQWYPVLAQPAGVKTGPLSQQWCEYATWGYWSSIQRWYADPDIIFKAEGFWVGGQPTSHGDMISLFTANGGNGTIARYQGGAAVNVYENGVKTSSAFGTSDLTFTFQTANPSFFGNIIFPSLKFDVEGDSVWPNGFLGRITRFNDEETPTGHLNGIFGKFYGPQAKNVAGGFCLENEGIYYNGVFGGTCVSKEAGGQKTAQ